MRRRSNNLLQQSLLAATGAQMVGVTVDEEQRKLRVKATWADGTERDVEVKFSPGTLPEAAKIAANKLRRSEDESEAVRDEPDVPVDSDAGVRRKERRAAKKR